MPRPLPSPLPVRVVRRFAVLISLLLTIGLAPDLARARVSLEALRRDGYGMVELSRPEPNILTVSATINGRKARLIVDTGWSGEGITVKADYAQTLRSQVEGVRNFGRAASGQALTG